MILFGFPHFLEPSQQTHHATNGLLGCVFMLVPSRVDVGQDLMLKDSGLSFWIAQFWRTKIRIFSNNVCSGDNILLITSRSYQTSTIKF